ncbi:hypothetical protein P154DRAFT_423794 [Amniculicola lignicola CBS 123094]|uniref:F-box domain-containing protein n=1 Tax=Amniculicola lignicola CBS 123094 TaxID=1392246 RepID=A0A6A5WV18_9PLEO|nr:hypothetical protein P154DRAFT_423794 [Amniculicola lignicola CBS 123094]
MTITLDRLPFDVLFYIASSLGFNDIIHLSQTCHQLKLLLEESTLCRKAIENHALHSKEAKLAQEKIITYREAVQSVYERRRAFSNAYPFSARIVGQGTAFTYRQGVLCVLHGSTIRVLEVHSSSQFLEIDLNPIIDSLLESSGESPGEPKFSLLYYSDGILAIHYDKPGRQNNGRILAISTRKDAPERILRRARLIRDIVLEASSKLFVRHTEHYLYYGTYSAMGDHNHHEWELRGVSLDRDHPIPRHQPLQLVEFFGTDIGPTIAFACHDGYFYAVSNQTSFDVEELDWTSFYHCVRFPLDDPAVNKEPEINTRVYRRQHAEGPIHDSWTDLTLQVDESTNELVIVESRREWQNGSSRQLRTFYVAPIDFKKASSAEDSPSNVPALPLDDQFTQLLDPSNKPNWGPPEARLSRDTHPEFGQGCGTTRPFILARTKVRAYNYSCRTFIDVVEDDKCCGDPYSPPCLRIRTGAWRLAPRDRQPQDKPVISKSQKVTPRPADDLPYEHTLIKMWPPPATKCPCSKRLHEILNPPILLSSGMNRMVTGVADERSLVYLVKPGRSYVAEENALGTLVVINFNRETRTMASPDSDSGQAQEMKDLFNPSDWHWSREQNALCETQACR